MHPPENRDINIIGADQRRAGGPNVRSVPPGEGVYAATVDFGYEGIVRSGLTIFGE